MNKSIFRDFIVTIIMSGVIVGCGHTSKPSDSAEVKGFIGVATMLTDETIILNIRSETEHDGIVHTSTVYRKNHPQYNYIKDHIGTLRPGQKKSIKPFPP